MEKNALNLCDIKQKLIDFLRENNYSHCRFEFDVNRLNGSISTKFVEIRRKGKKTIILETYLD